LRRVDRAGRLASRAALPGFAWSRSRPAGRG